MNGNDPYESYKFPDNERVKADTKKTEEEMLYSGFDDFRQTWKARIQELAQMFKDVNKLSHLQVCLYSDRQFIVEYMYRLLDISATVTKRIRGTKRQLFEKYSTSEDHRYTTNEKNAMIDMDLKDIKERMDHYDNQIEYCKETLKTYDSMIFGVKHRLTVEELRTQ